LTGLTLIRVPFHLGLKAVGMGKGPLELLGEGGIPDRLQGAGYDIEMTPLADFQPYRWI
jgi:hypothetical protein